MDIKDLRRDPAPITPTTPAAPIRQVGKIGTNAEPGRAPREDSVEISDQGRSLSGATEGPDDVPQGTLPADRLLELRRRLQSRVHDSPEMIRAIARGIVSRGDL